MKKFFLPDGTFYTADENKTQEEFDAFAMQNHPEMFGPAGEEPEAEDISSFRSEIINPALATFGAMPEQFAGTAKILAGEALGREELVRGGAESFEGARATRERLDPNAPLRVGLREAYDRFIQGDLSGGVEHLKSLPASIAQNTAYVAPMLATGKAVAVATGNPIAGAAAGSTLLFGQHLNENLEEQINQGRLTAEDIEILDAVKAAAVNTGLDMASLLFMGAGKFLGLTGPAKRMAVSSALKKPVIAAVASTLNAANATAARKVALAALGEGGTETLQRVNTMIQSGQDVDIKDEDDAWALAEEFWLASVTGGVFGGAGHAYSTMKDNAVKRKEKAALTVSEGQARKLQNFAELNDQLEVGRAEEEVRTAQVAAQEAGVFRDQEGARRVQSLMDNRDANAEDIVTAAENRNINSDDVGFSAFLERATGKETLKELGAVELNNVYDMISQMPVQTNRVSMPTVFPKDVKSLAVKLSKHFAGVRGPRNVTNQLIRDLMGVEDKYTSDEHRAAAVKEYRKALKDAGVLGGANGLNYISPRSISNRSAEDLQFETGAVNEIDYKVQRVPLFTVRDRNGEILAAAKSKKEILEKEKELKKHGNKNVQEWVLVDRDGILHPTAPTFALKKAAQAAANGERLLAINREKAELRASYTGPAHLFPAALLDPKKAAARHKFTPKLVDHTTVSTQREQVHRVRERQGSKVEDRGYFDGTRGPEGGEAGAVNLARQLTQERRGQEVMSGLEIEDQAGQARPMTQEEIVSLRGPMAREAAQQLIDPLPRPPTPEESRFVDEQWFLDLLKEDNARKVAISKKLNSIISDMGIGKQFLAKVIDDISNGALGRMMPATRMIELALSDVPAGATEAEAVNHLAVTLNHEAFHAFMLNGLINEKQWSTLSDAVRNKINPNSGRTFYETISSNENYQDRWERLGESRDLAVDEESFYLEESMADMFGVYATERAAKAPKKVVVGPPAGIFKKIVNAILGASKALRKSGAETADDIFESMMSGETAKLYEDNKVQRLNYVYRPKYLARVEERQAEKLGQYAEMNEFLVAAEKAQKEAETEDKPSKKPKKQPRRKARKKSEDDLDEIMNYSFRTDFGDLTLKEKHVVDDLRTYQRREPEVKDFIGIAENKLTEELTLPDRRKVEKRLEQFQEWDDAMAITMGIDPKDAGYVNSDEMNTRVQNNSGYESVYSLLGDLRAMVFLTRSSPLANSEEFDTEDELHRAVFQRRRLKNKINVHKPGADYVDMYVSLPEAPLVVVRVKNFHPQTQDELTKLYYDPVTNSHVKLAALKSTVHDIIFNDGYGRANRRDLNDAYGPKTIVEAAKEHGISQYDDTIAEDGDINLYSIANTKYPTYKWEEINARDGMTDSEYYQASSIRQSPDGENWITNIMGSLSNGALTMTMSTVNRDHQYGPTLTPPTSGPAGMKEAVGELKNVFMPTLDVIKEIVNERSPVRIKFSGRGKYVNLYRKYGVDAMDALGYKVDWEYLFGDADSNVSLTFERKPDGAKPSEGNRFVEWAAREPNVEGRTIEDKFKVDDTSTVLGIRGVRVALGSEERLGTREEEIQQNTEFTGWKDLLNSTFEDMNIAVLPRIPRDSDSGGFDYFITSERETPVVVRTNSDSEVMDIIADNNYGAAEGISDVHGEGATSRSVAIAEGFMDADDSDTSSYSFFPRRINSENTETSQLVKRILTLPNEGTFWDNYKDIRNSHGFGSVIRQKFFDKFHGIERMATRAAAKAQAEGKPIRAMIASSGAHQAALIASRGASFAAGTFDNGAIRYNGTTMDGGTIVEALDFTDSLNTGIYDRPGGNKGGLSRILYPLMYSKEGDWLGTDRLYEYFAWKTAKRGSRLSDEGRLIPLLEDDVRLGEALGNDVFEVVDENFNQWNNATVDYAIKTGVIDEDVGEVWKKHSDHIPFYLNLQGETSEGISDVVASELGRDRSSAVINSLVGDKSPKTYKGRVDIKNMDPLQAIQRNQTAMIAAGLKNIASQRALRDAVYLDEARPTENEGAIDTVHVRIKGKDYLFQVDDRLLFESLTGSFDGISPFLAMLARPSNFLRETITRSPSFIIANTLRDSVSSYVTTGASMKPVIGSVNQIIQNIRSRSLGPDVDTYRQLENLGVVGGWELGSVRGTGSRGLERILKNQGKQDLNLRSLRRVWDGLGGISARSEAAVRQLVYEDVLNRTGDVFEAGYQANEVLNFTRMGNSSAIRVMSALIPFSNARLQGLDVLYRTARGRNSAHRSLKSPQEIQKTMLVRMGTIASLSFLYGALMQDDEVYKNQREETKLDNLVFRIPGTDKAVLFPKAFEVGYLSMTVPEQLGLMATGGGDYRVLGRGMREFLGGNVAINPIPQAGLPIIEAIADYNFYTGKPIVGRYQKAGPYSSGPYTNDVARVLGEASGISPDKLEHIMRGYSGTLGTYALSIADYVSRAATGRATTSRMAAPVRNFPLVKRFVADTMGTAETQEFYRNLDLIDEYAGAVKHMSDVRDFKGKNSLRSKNTRLHGISSTMRARAERLQEINKKKRKIENAEYLTPEEKFSRIKMLDSKAKMVTESINKLFKQIDLTIFGSYRI